MKRCLRCQTRFTHHGWACPNCGAAPAESNGIPVFAPALAEGDGSDADYRYDALAAAEMRHFWFVRRAMLLAWAIQKYSPSARTLLDVGCGTGGVVAALGVAIPVLQISAGDSRLAGLEYVRRRTPGVEILQCQACELPFDSEFDVAGAFDVIEHIDDDLGALSALRDVVKPGGLVLIAVPQHPWLWSTIDDFSRHRRRYTRAELRSKLESVGLQVVRMTSFAVAALPALWITRHIPQPFDPERELRISRIPNAIFGALAAMEHRVIAAGFSLPAGGSLLAIARRPAESSPAGRA